MQIEPNPFQSFMTDLGKHFERLVVCEDQLLCKQASEVTGHNFMKPGQIYAIFLRQVLEHI
jgi:hypothetical protein